MAAKRSAGELLFVPGFACVVALSDDAGSIQIVEFAFLEYRTERFFDCRIDDEDILVAVADDPR